LNLGYWGLCHFIRFDPVILAVHKQNNNILRTELVSGIRENKRANLDASPWLRIKRNLGELEGSMRRNYRSISLSL
jgi:hypothetical protein